MHVGVNVSDRSLYGYEHKKARKAWKAQVEAGSVTCWRCNEPIAPDAQWDLGHVDGTHEYAGPEHRACNRATLTHAKQSASTTYEWF